MAFFFGLFGVTISVVPQWVLPRKVQWSQAPPKGFSIKIEPSTGLVSGKIPATQGGKSVLLPYQGILFSENLDIGPGVPLRGAGFVTGDGISNAMVITSE